MSFGNEYMSQGKRGISNSLRDNTDTYYRSRYYDNDIIRFMDKYLFKHGVHEVGQRSMRWRVRVGQRSLASRRDRSDVQSNKHI